VDAGAANTYLVLKMLRKLVTLLALLTGLAAISAPVEARALTVAAVRVEATGLGSVQAGATQVSRSAFPVEVIAGYQAQPKSHTHSKAVVYFPTVQLGADRARE
jgi:hypothetical protein